VDIIEERWIWERYQPLNINLKNNEELIIRNRQTGEEEKIPCEPSFFIECDALIEDDFKDISPLITGKWIKIVAPRENPSGWIVEVQNKQVGWKSWTEEKSLELKLPDDLPCECGEFQVNIFDKEDGNPVETLFFRYVPSLQLKFPRDLIVPDPNKGHKEETIEILFGEDFQDWELKHEKTIKYENIENGYKIELPPQQDVIHFSLMKKGKSETETRVKITIPRLKWRTSKSESWHDRPIQIRRDELITGEDFYLTVCTNDFDTQYDLLAILETTSEKLQEAKFKQKGRYYNLLLNQFYDTIKENNDKISLRMEIRKVKDNEVLGQTEVIHLPEVAQEGSKDTLLRRNIRPNVKGGNGRFRIGKGFSKKEVKEAGISMDRIKNGRIKINNCCIPVDKRRKSVYSENVKILKSLMGGM
jgi:ribosomal protein L13E